MKKIAPSLVLIGLCLGACNSEPDPVIGDDPNAKASVNTSPESKEKAAARPSLSVAPPPTGTPQGK